MRLIDWNLNNLGNTDRSLSAAVILIPQGTISGVKFNDIDGDGVKDTGETGLAGWTITLNPSAVTAVTDSTGIYSFAGLADGTYTVCETMQSGWTQTSPTTDTGSCSGTNGYSITISGGINPPSSSLDFGNNQIGHIIIVKDAVPDDAQDFSFTNNFGNANPSSFDLDDDADGTLSNTRDSAVIAGTYSVSEGAVSGWAQTSAICSDGSPVSAIVVSAGETVPCTFTNTKDATLTLIKTVITDNGGTAVANDFQGKIDGGNVAWSVAEVVSVGAHSASETTLAGYSASLWDGDCATDGSVSLTAGENKTCSITNNDQQSYEIGRAHV